jgi:hypothetical protein
MDVYIELKPPADLERAKSVAQFLNQNIDSVTIELDAVSPGSAAAGLAATGSAWPLIPGNSGGPGARTFDSTREEGE